MLTILLGFIVYVITAIAVAVLLKIPPKTFLTAFAIGMWWLFF